MTYVLSSTLKNQSTPSWYCAYAYFIARNVRSGPSGMATAGNVSFATSLTYSTLLHRCAHVARTSRAIEFKRSATVMTTQATRTRVYKFSATDVSSESTDDAVTQRATSSERTRHQKLAQTKRSIHWVLTFR